MNKRAGTEGGSITVRDLSFSYPGSRLILDRITMTVKPGQIVSVLGPNGSGKSTLLGCLCNLLTPAGGEICLNGRPIPTMAQREIAQIVGYVPQSIEPSFAFTVTEYVITGCAPSMSLFGRPSKEHYDIAAGAIRHMGIEHLAERSYMNLSGGERQLAALARALAQRPDFILLDEPVAHLDCGNQIKVLRLIRRLADEGYGILLTTHNPDHALLLGGMAALLNRQGRLSFGPTEDILKQEVLTELYGTDLKISWVEELSRTVCIAPKL